MKYKLLVVTETLDDLVNTKNLSAIKSFFDNAKTYKLIDDYENSNMENSFNRAIYKLEKYDANKYCVWAALDSNNDLYYCVKVVEDVKISDTNCIIKFKINLSEGIIFTDKEIEILKNERLNKYCISIGALIDYIKNEDEDGWMIEKVKNWNMTYSELQEFKSKLEKLML